MTTMFVDVNNRTSKSIEKQRVQGFSKDEFLYADDAILVSQSGKALNARSLAQAVSAQGSRLRYP